MVAVLLVMFVRYRRETGHQIIRVGRPGLLAGALLAAAGICVLQAITNTTVAATLFICSAIPFITAAFAWVFLRETPQKSTLITMCVAALGVFIMISGAIIAAVTLPLLWGQLVVPWRDVIWCFMLGGFISALPNVLFIIASRHLVAAELTLFMLLEFALGPVWVWLFINEIPARWTVIGGSLVVGSVLCRVMFELRQNRHIQS
jgi:drug/metabolite transporter (DMT)-like permease